MKEYKDIPGPVGRLDMKPHEEGGLIAENHYPHEGEGRAESGSAYYYVYRDKPSAFHKLDCDEYWAYHAGDALEIWMIRPDGKLERRRLGLDADAEPCIFVERGTVFAARHPAGSREGTLVSTITVPRFSQKGITLLGKEEILELNGACRDFFEP